MLESASLKVLSLASSALGLAKGIIEREGWLFPDTLVGTDSHTPMVNGLGVVGW